MEVRCHCEGKHLRARQSLGARTDQSRMHKEEGLVLKSKSPKVSEFFPEVLKSNIHKHIEAGERNLEKTPLKNILLPHIRVNKKEVRGESRL